MKGHVTYKNISPASHERIEQLIDRMTEKHLERHLSHMQPDMVQLFAIVEKNRHHHDLYRVALRLHVPRTVLVAREDGHDLEVILREAFEELERQVERYLARLRRDDAWRRKERRAELRRLKAGLAEEGAPAVAGFTDLVQSELGMLEQFVRRELTYLQALGDLPPDYPTVEDIVDETLLRALRRRDQRDSEQPVALWLRQIATEVIDEAVDTARANRPELLSLEGRPPRDALAELSEAERLDYWQPDEVLHIEDLVPSPESESPEEQVAQQQLLARIYRRLAGLPTAWRRALMLHRVDGLPVEQVAAVLGTDPATVQGWLAQADAWLRATLRQDGADIPEQGEPGDFIPAAPAVVASETLRLAFAAVTSG